MAFKMAPRSPLMKSLKGGQKNLSVEHQKAIEAAPGKMMDSPAKMGRGERYDEKMASDQNLTAGARKNYAENAEAAQKSSPAKNMNKGYGSPAKNMNKGYGSPAKLDAKNKNTAAKAAAAKAARRKANGDKTPMPPTGDSPAKNMNKGYGSPAKLVLPKSASKASAYTKEVNDLVKSRGGLKKGTAEYNKVQNQINSKLGSKVRRKTTDLQETVKLSTKSGKTTKTPKLVATPARPSSATADKVKVKKKVNTPNLREVGGGAAKGGVSTLTVKTGGGANKGGSTKRERVTKNSKKVVTKTGDTRTVEKTNKDGSSSTKTTKRIGKGRIKGAIKEARLARLDRVGKRQAAKVAKRKSTSTQNKMDGLGK